MLKLSNSIMQDKGSLCVYTFFIISRKISTWTNTVMFYFKFAVHVKNLFSDSNSRQYNSQISYKIMFIED